MRTKFQTAKENYSLLEAFAKEHRKNPTEAESIIWNFLKGNALGVHFRQQHVLLDYIPDFVCLSRKIVIEIDGGYHLDGEQNQRDEERTKELENLGYKVIRFSNEEVIGNTKSVMERIKAAVTETPSLREGRGWAPISIIKVGGAVVEDPQQLDALIEEFASIEGPKLLVHGGGRSATKMAERLGIESRMVNGRRITDEQMLTVVTMVYGGLVNKNIVARMQARGINAVGLTGADLNVIRAHRRPPLVVNGSPIDYGFVGDVDSVDASALAALIGEGFVPVMAPLTHDGNGNMLNTNADTIASEVAKALSLHYDVTLKYHFEKLGVMGDPDDPATLIPQIDHASFERLKAEGIVSGGMIPKIENALKAIDAGVNRIFIGQTLVNKG